MSLKLKQTPETVDLLSQQVLEAWVQFDVVFPQVAEQLVRPQDLGDSDQLNHENKSERVENSNCEMVCLFVFFLFLCWSNLIVVVLSVEEGLFLKDHTGQHAAQAPHVQTVVIHLKHTSPTPTPVKAWLYFIKM